MKYATLFALAGALLMALAASKGGYYWIVIWPAISSFAISLAYFRLEPRVFGKRADGTMSGTSSFVLLPYLVYLWFVWHVVRLFSREDCSNQVSDELTIGRRVLPSELPAGVDVVVDLTCEFPEPKRIRTSHEYRSFPLLDGIAPTAESLVNIAREIAELEGHLYVHCAQGHGRTALVAAALLLMRRHATDPSSAIECIQSARPQIRLSKSQRECLQKTFLMIAEADAH